MWGTAIAVNLGLFALVVSVVVAEVPMWLRLAFATLAAIFAVLAAALIDQVRVKPLRSLWRAARYLCWVPAVIFAIGSLDLGIVSGQETLAIVAMVGVGAWNWIGLGYREPKHA